MLNDKDIANDVLEMMKHETTDMLKACLESSNQQLRQTLMQFVNDGVKGQFQMYQLAEGNDWYLPAAMADPAEIEQVRSFYAAPVH